MRSLILAAVFAACFDVGYARGSGGTDTSSATDDMVEAVQGEQRSEVEDHKETHNNAVNEVDQKSLVLKSTRRKLEELNAKYKEVSMSLVASTSGLEKETANKVKYEGKVSNTKNEKRDIKNQCSADETELRKELKDSVATVKALNLAIKTVSSEKGVSKQKFFAMLKELEVDFQKAADEGELAIANLKANCAQQTQSADIVIDSETDNLSRCDRHIKIYDDEVTKYQDQKDALGSSIKEATEDIRALTVAIRKLTRRDQEETKDFESSQATYNTAVKQIRGGTFLQMPVNPIQAVAHNLKTVASKMGRMTLSSLADSIIELNAAQGYGDERCVFHGVLQAIEKMQSNLRDEQTALTSEEEHCTKTMNDLGTTMSNLCGSMQRAMGERDSQQAKASGSADSLADASRDKADAHNEFTSSRSSCSKGRVDGTARKERYIKFVGLCKTVFEGLSGAEGMESLRSFIGNLKEKFERKIDTTAEEMSADDKTCKEEQNRLKIKESKHGAEVDGYTQQTELYQAQASQQAADVREMETQLLKHRTRSAALYHSCDGVEAPESVSATWAPESPFGECAGDEKVSSTQMSARVSSMRDRVQQQRDARQMEQDSLQSAFETLTSRCEK